MNTADASNIDTEPLFSPEAQQCFTPGDRVYAIEDTEVAKEGSEGVYVGRFQNTAIIGWDTPSGELYKAQTSFASIRQLWT